METNVWMRLFVQVASYLSSLFASLNSPKNPNNGGASQNAPANDAASISTSTSVTSQVLRVVRNPTLATKDGVFGDIIFEGRQVGVSCENKTVMIPVGVYSATKDLSPRLGYVCPHLKVPSRDKIAGGDAGIRIHILNEPNQSEGCIGVGSCIDGDAVDNSRVVFAKLMTILPQTFTVEIC